jgi:hypothetical protein
MPVSWITHNGKSILYADFRSQKEEALRKTLDDLAAEYQKASGKVLMLVDFDKSTIDASFMLKAKEYGNTYFTPKSERMAIINITSIQEVMLSGYNLANGNRLKHFKTIDETKDYLSG